LLTSPGQGSDVAGDLDGLPVFFIGKEAYIRNKRATGGCRIQQMRRRSNYPIHGFKLAEVGADSRR